MSIRKGTMRVIKRVERETGMRFAKRDSEPGHFEFFWFEYFKVREMDGGVSTEYETFTETFHNVAEMLDFVRKPAVALLKCEGVTA